MSYRQRPASPVRENGFSAGRRRADYLNDYLSRVEDWSLPEIGGCVEPQSHAELAAALLDYLGRRLQLTDLDYWQPPSEITDGWDSYTYRFRLDSSALLPPDYAGPLAVSIYSGPQAIPRVRHEFAVQRYIHQVGYPAPKILLVEDCCSYLGGPFLVKAHVPGQPLLDTLLHRPWKILWEPARMAELHGWLHRLPTHDFPNGDGTLFPRTLEELAEIVHAHHFRGLVAGLDWLVANEPAPPATPSILHLDFHPYNLIQDDEGSLVVIDWTEAGIGDFHADVAETLMMLKCMPTGKTRLRDRLAVGPGRPLLRRRYLRAYRKHRPIDDETLRYYCAKAAFRRLCQYQRWLRHGPQLTGSNSRLLSNLRPQLLQTLRDYFRKHTGICLW